MIAGSDIAQMMELEATRFKLERTDHFLEKYWEDWPTRPSIQRVRSDRR